MSLIRAWARSELPVDGVGTIVAMGLPGVNFMAKDFEAGDPAIRTLARPRASAGWRMRLQRRMDRALLWKVEAQFSGHMRWQITLRDSSQTSGGSAPKYLHLLANVPFSPCLPAFFWASLFNPTGCLDGTTFSIYIQPYSGCKFPSITKARLLSFNRVLF